MRADILAQAINQIHTSAEQAARERDPKRRRDHLRAGAITACRAYRSLSYPEIADGEQAIAAVSEEVRALAREFLTDDSLFANLVDAEVDLLRVAGVFEAPAVEIREEFMALRERIDTDGSLDLARSIATLRDYVCTELPGVLAADDRHDENRSRLKTAGLGLAGAASVAPNLALLPVAAPLSVASVGLGFAAVGAALARFFS